MAIKVQHFRKVLPGITRNIYSAKTRHKAVQVARHTLTEVTAPAWGQRVTEGGHDFLVSCQMSTQQSAMDRQSDCRQGTV